MYDAGQYEEAIAVFTELDGYRDSAEQITACRRAEAHALLNQGEYEAGYAILQTTDGPETIREDKVERAYAAAEAGEYGTAAVGDTVRFGAYRQAYERSNADLIEWNVLAKDGDKLLLLSRYTLERMPFHTSTDPTVTWGTCSLREWLNGTFYETAFNADEQKMIQQTTLKSDSRIDKYQTTDPVFLLSETEFSTYCMTQDLTDAYPTPYSMGSETVSNSVVWWLRSKRSEYGTAGAFALAIRENAPTRVAFGNANISVRPAIWVNLTRIP